MSHLLHQLRRPWISTIRFKTTLKQENKSYFFIGKKKLMHKFYHRVVNFWSMVSWIQIDHQGTKTDVQILHVCHFWFH